MVLGSRAIGSFQGSNKLQEQTGTIQVGALTRDPSVNYVSIHFVKVILPINLRFLMLFIAINDVKNLNLQLENVGCS